MISEVLGVSRISALSECPTNLSCPHVVFVVFIGKYCNCNLNYLAFQLYTQPIDRQDYIWGGGGGGGAGG